MQLGGGRERTWDAPWGRSPPPPVTHKRSSPLPNFTPSVGRNVPFVYVYDHSLPHTLLATSDVEGE
ncbi:unnamed protein product [Spirodela intermedia]|uniref:Uncharacterized protein n=1 Tax=Spirodela intermedia TaxID=51605 RepID=A0A7I8L768_SPIIN|nr:unnamed protein product [Spirodela intermedia]